jgi:hypothetical protein
MSQQRRKGDARLAPLLNSAEALRKEEAEQRKDEQRVKSLVRALPEAFIYEYEGFETDSAGEQLERLTFAPNPSFRPSAREPSVLTGMKDTMLVNTTAMHLVRVEATLFRGVSFGWGILARLNPRGCFLWRKRPSTPDGGRSKR